ncbi:MAG: hypothetical protein M1448_03870 [Candidatus Marsarchaeota archaeon]|jgi:hypothetical protein|nr:hypothetical protein [Candidatus Marsarchaeota archaeon]
MAKEKQGRQGIGAGMEIAAYVVVAIVVVSVIYLYLSHLGNSSSSNFLSFKSAFNSAPHVGIYVAYLNGTTFSYTMGCATTLIEELTANRTTHRVPNTINFYVINGTSCIYSNGLGNPSSNYSNLSSSGCISFSKSVPSIFINYTAENNTVVSGKDLYFSGSTKYLSECGIAYEVT